MDKLPIIISGHRELHGGRKGAFHRIQLAAKFTFGYCEEMNLGLDRRVLIDEGFGYFKQLITDSINLNNVFGILRKGEKFHHSPTQELIFWLIHYNTR